MIEFASGVITGALLFMVVNLFYEWLEQKKKGGDDK